jgi:hypothetical protein
MFPGTNICQLKISVQNPLETDVMFNLGQDLPVGGVVIDAADAVLSNNHLSWDFDLPAGQAKYFQVVLQLSPNNDYSALTNATVSAYDAVNANWLPFSQAPVISQMISSLPPQLQPAGFSSNQFGLNLQALIPGVYNVEGTTDFINWTSVISTTNTAGQFRIVDPIAQSLPMRFYRASRR